MSAEPVPMEPKKQQRRRGNYQQPPPMMPPVYYPQPVYYQTPVYYQMPVEPTPPEEDRAQLCLEALQEVDEILTATKGQIAQLEGNMKQTADMMNEELHKLHQSVETLKKQSTTATSAVPVDVSSLRKALKKQSDTLDAISNSLEISRSSAKKDIEDLQGKMNRQEERAVKLERRLESLPAPEKVDVTPLQDRQMLLEQQVKKMQEMLTDFEGRFTNLEAIVRNVSERPRPQAATGPSKAQIEMIILDAASKTAKSCETAVQKDRLELQKMLEDLKERMEYFQKMSPHLEAVELVRTQHGGLAGQFALADQGVALLSAIVPLLLEYSSMISVGLFEHFLLEQTPANRARILENLDRFLTAENLSGAMDAIVEKKLLKKLYDFHMQTELCDGVMKRFAQTVRFSEHCMTKIPRLSTEQSSADMYTGLIRKFAEALRTSAPVVDSPHGK